MILVTTAGQVGRLAARTFEQVATDYAQAFRDLNQPRSGNGVIMPTTTDTSRTARLLALMKKGDDAFNARDFAAVDTVHHPDMIAYITGLAEPVYGKKAHSAAMQQFLRIFPDMHVYSDPYPIQFGSGDWITVVTNATGTF